MAPERFRDFWNVSALSRYDSSASSYRPRLDKTFPRLFSTYGGARRRAGKSNHFVVLAQRAFPIAQPFVRKRAVGQQTQRFILRFVQSDRGVEVRDRVLEPFQVHQTLRAAFEPPAVARLELVQLSEQRVGFVEPLGAVRRPRAHLQVANASSVIAAAARAGAAVRRRAEPEKRGAEQRAATRRDGVVGLGRGGRGCPGGRGRAGQASRHRRVGNEPPTRLGIARESRGHRRRETSAARHRAHSQSAEKRHVEAFPSSTLRDK